MLLYSHTVAHIRFLDLLSAHKKPILPAGQMQSPVSALHLLPPHEHWLIQFRPYLPGGHAKEPKL